MDKYFDFIAGSNLGNTRSKKADVIRYVLDSVNISDCSAAVMIGDRKHDIIGAKETGLRSIGVLYGYAAVNELEQAGADFIEKTPEDIFGIINSN